MKNLWDNDKKKLYKEIYEELIQEGYSPHEAKKYASLLGYNYGSGKWYKATYQIFNKEYEFNEKKVFSEKKKNKETLLKKFKKRFKNLFK